MEKITTIKQWNDFWECYKWKYMLRFPTLKELYDVFREAVKKKLYK